MQTFTYESFTHDGRQAVRDADTAVRTAITEYRRAAALYYAEGNALTRDALTATADRLADAIRLF